MSDILGQLGGAADDAAKAEQPTARLEWSGNQGELSTGAVDASFDPSDLTGVFEKIGRKFGLNPEVDRLELCAGTLWEQRSRNRETDEFETVMLYAYRYKVVKSSLPVHLPALYAEQGYRKPVKAKQSAEATVVVCWADIQTGKVDHLGGLKELLERLDQKRDALDAYLKSASFDHIVIADCGDLIEGFSNFPAQHRTNALSIMDQIDVAATEMWKTITLCERHAPVDVLSIPSNHCAWRRDGKNLAGKVGDDWGLHISKSLERRNEEAKRHVTFHRTGDWEETLQFDVRGTRLGLAHGHQVNNPDQIKNWWAKMTHAGVLDCHVLVTGHFHFASLRPSGRDAVTQKSRWHVQASTLDNGSAWVRNKMGEDGDPALTVFQINNDGFDVQSFALL